MCVAACSRTSATDLYVTHLLAHITLTLYIFLGRCRAYQALRLLLIPPQGTGKKSNGDTDTNKAIPAIEFFDQLEIYPGAPYMLPTNQFLFQLKSGIKDPN